MKRLKNENGVITMITLITVLFMVSFLISSYIIIANKVKTQKEMMAETKSIYEPKTSMEEVYNSYFSNENLIYIYSDEQLINVGTGNVVNVNGKYYNFNNDKNTTYILMNNLALENDNWQEIEKKLRANFVYNNCTIESNGEIFDGNVDYVDGMVLWLDGIQNTREGHVDDLTVWHDISGNNYDYNMTGVTTTEKSVIFAGTESSYGEIADKNNITKIFGDSFSSPLTIEAVVTYKDTKLTEIICSNNTIKKAIRIGYNQNNRVLADWVGYTTNLGKWYIPDYSKVETVTIVYGDTNTTYRKGQQLSTSSTGGLSASAATTSKIGRWMSGNNVEIYSIRVYPRQLTESEIWQNFKADRQRFGISL